MIFLVEKYNILVKNISLKILKDIKFYFKDIFDLKNLIF